MSCSRGISLAAAMLLVTAAAAAADETKLFCMGEFESSCFPGYDIYVPTVGGRGVDDEVIARNFCTARSAQDGRLSGRYRHFRLNTKSGNCCGYALIRVTCLDN